MSFRMFAAVLFFGLLIAGVTANAGFCAQLVQSNGPANLNNGANTVNLGSGAWTTSAVGTFSDGQFQTDGGYIIPVGGVYHFDAVMQVQVVSISPPNQEVDIRVVKCSGGCNALCSGGTDVGETLIQSGSLYLSAGFTAALPPEYSLSVSYTGLFNTGDLVALCIDSQASSSAVKLNCPSNTCLFSGFAAN